MPLPRLLAQINKRTFNKREVKRNKYAVLTHVGRSSGKTYRTPLEVHERDGGYLIILMYGSKSDWVKNVLADGKAGLRLDGDDIDLVSPRVVDWDIGWAQMPESAKPPASFLKVTEFLQMDVRR